MADKYHLASGSNTLGPAYFLLKEKGYTVSMHYHFCVAENENLRVMAEDWLQVAGLVMLYENKGENWRVDDALLETLPFYIDPDYQP